MDMTGAVRTRSSHLVLLSHLGLTHPNRTRLRCGDNVALLPHLGLTHPNRA